MKLLDPVAIPQDTSGNPLPFTIVLPSAQRPAAVKLSNQSPWPLGARMSGFADWLDAYTADVYPVPGDAFEIDFSPKVIIATPARLSASVLPVLAYPGERFPGTYPMALPRQSASYLNPAPLVVNASDSGIYTTAPNTVLTNVVYPLPAGATAVRFEINQLGANTKWVNNTIVGNVTGKRYNLGTGNPGGPGGFDETWAIAPEDTALLFSIDTTGSPNAVKYWFTAPAAYSAVKVVSNGIEDGLPLFVRNDSTPAPWQSFPLSKRIDIVATGADQAVGIGDGVRSLCLGPATLFSDHNARFAFKDGSGGTTRWMQVVDAASTSKAIPWNGLKLTAGNDLWVNGPNGDEIEFSVTYNLG